MNATLPQLNVNVKTSGYQLNSTLICICQKDIQSIVVVVVESTMLTHGFYTESIVAWELCNVTIVIKVHRQHLRYHDMVSIRFFNTHP